MAEGGWFDFLSGQKRREWADDVNEWVDEKVRRYGGPHLHAALYGTKAGELGYGQPARGGMVPAIAELTPGADMRDLQQGSGQLMHGLIDLQPSQMLGGATLMGGATLGTMVPGSVSGYRKAAKETTDALKKGIRAYHGSPHDFQKFSLEHIGKGEGAQAYGHGLYFAENENVAKAYREALSAGGGASARDTAARILDSAGGDYDKALDVATDRFNAALRRGKMAPEAYDRWMKVRRMLFNKEPVAGRMYEVNINANPEDFLDWDKPLSQQSEKVKAAVKKVFGDVPNPETTFIQDISPEQSKALREAGVGGIRYLDQGSREAGKGSRNFVVFDDATIEILRKYGILPPLLAAGGGATLMQQQNNQRPAPDSPPTL